MVEEPVPRARPAIHYTPPSGWLNDPHGIVHHRGVYHLFHQSVPSSTVWTPAISWGHATSPDLLSWRTEPTALEPAEDEVGCWTGCLVLPPGRDPVALYTSVAEPDLQVGAVRVATPTDESLREWLPGPRLDLPTDGLSGRLRVLRDPSVRWDGGRWRLIVGAGYVDRRPAVIGWSSDDLRSWDLDGELVVGPPDAGGLGTAWECPQLVEVDGATVVLVSAWEEGETGEVFAAVGEVDGGRLVHDGWTRVTHGRSHYAPSVFRDADGRACVMFWIRGVADEAAGWAGALSVPYVVGVVDGRFALAMHPAVLGSGLVTEIPSLEDAVTLVEDGRVVELCTGRVVTGWSVDGRG